jgi:hypothetical protein
MCFLEVFENQGYILEPFFAFLKGHDFSKEIAKTPPKIKKEL